MRGFIRSFERLLGRVVYKHIKSVMLYIYIFDARNFNKHTISPLNAIEGIPLLEYWVQRDKRMTWIKRRVYTK